jgi:anaerobic selenocysteine-containing dehydrogenase
VEASLPDGRWRVAPPELVEQLAKLAERQPGPELVLVPRRQPRHMNSLLRDAGASGRLDEPVVLLHPDEAYAQGVADGEAVVVRSSDGAMRGVARHDPQIRRGVVSVPHGWPGEAHVGRLVSGRVGDPLTGMVRLSGVPVEIAPDDAGAPEGMPPAQPGYGATA